MEILYGLMLFPLVIICSMLFISIFTVIIVMPIAIPILKKKGMIDEKWKDKSTEEIISSYCKITFPAIFYYWYECILKLCSKFTFITKK